MAGKALARTSAPAQALMDREAELSHESFMTFRSENVLGLLWEQALGWTVNSTRHQPALAIHFPPVSLKVKRAPQRCSRAVSGRFL